MTARKMMGKVNYHVFMGVLTREIVNIITGGSKELYNTQYCFHVLVLWLYAYVTVCVCVCKRVQRARTY